jgi:hypothetical protein
MSKVQTNQVLLAVLAVGTALIASACTLSDISTIISILTALGII